MNIYGKDSGEPTNQGNESGLMPSLQATRFIDMKTIWQINPEEDEPKPFKDKYLHRGCIRYEPRRMLTKLTKEVEKKGGKQ